MRNLQQKHHFILKQTRNGRRITIPQSASLSVLDCNNFLHHILEIKPNKAKLSISNTVTLDGCLMEVTMIGDLLLGQEKVSCSLLIEV